MVRFVEVRLWKSVDWGSELDALWDRWRVPLQVVQLHGVAGKWALSLVHQWVALLAVSEDVLLEYFSEGWQVLQWGVVQVRMLAQCWIVICCIRTDVVRVEHVFARLQLCSQ